MEEILAQYVMHFRVCCVPLDESPAAGAVHSRAQSLVTEFAARRQEPQLVDGG